MNGRDRGAVIAPPLLLAALMVLAALWRRRSRRQAAEALERWRERQREGGKGKKTARARKEGTGEGGRKAGTPRIKRLLRFLLLAAVREVITRQLGRMRRELPQSRLVERLSPSQGNEA